MEKLDSSVALALAELTAQSVAGNAGAAPATVGGALRMLAADDAYWDRLAAAAGDSDLARWRTLMRDADDRGPALSRDLLDRFGLTSGEIETILTEAEYEPHRTQAIRDAFAAASPTETARVLTGIAAHDHPGAWRERLTRNLSDQAGKIKVGYIIILSVLMAVLGANCGTMLVGMTLYKGVTPD